MKSIDWPKRVTATVHTFQELQTAVREAVRGRGAMAYRGYYSSDHSKSEPEALITGLERACKSIDGNLRAAHHRELAVIREFMRRAHHYESDLPGKGNAFEWLALMQHHGAPTRLLDWTYSLHVATHFALSKAARTESADMEVWMIDTEWCRNASSLACEVAGKPARSLDHWPIQSDFEEQASVELLDPDRPLSVWPINPFRLNERLTLQKGVFLAVGHPTESFVTNLRALSGHEEMSNVARFIVPHSQIAELGQDLDDANVTEATLFPGLDGFARSLWLSARYLNIAGITNICEI